MNKLTLTTALVAMLAFPAMSEGIKPQPQPVDPVVVYKQEGSVTGHQQQRQSANASARSNARATGGQANAQGGNANVTVQNGINSRTAATAYSADINGCGPGGGFSAGVQVLGFGVTAANCKNFYYNEVVEAEVNARQGYNAGAAYLAHKDRTARRALRDVGIVREVRRARGTPVPKTIEVNRIVSCPAGSTWDGSGCWAGRK